MDKVLVYGLQWSGQVVAVFPSICPWTVDNVLRLARIYNLWMVPKLGLGHDRPQMYKVVEKPWFGNYEAGRHTRHINRMAKSRQPCHSGTKRTCPNFGEEIAFACSDMTYLADCESVIVDFVFLFRGRTDAS